MTETTSRQPSRSRFARLAVITTVLVSLTAGVAQAELIAPTENDRRVAELVSLFLERAHLSRHPLDQEIAGRWFDHFLKTLDPMKTYFTQGDIDEFTKSKKKMVDWVKEGNIEFAYTIFKRYLERVQQRVDQAEKLIDTDFDYNKDEEIPRLAEVATYPKDDAAAADYWRRRVKYDLMVETFDDLDKKYWKGDTPEAKAKLEEARKEARETLKRRYSSFLKRMQQTDSDELLEMYLTAMTTSYDPHTTYMSPSTLDNFEISMRLELQGIGAALQYKDGFTTVTDIVPGGAADKDGRLKRNDKIVGVGQGKEGEIVDTVEMKLNDVVKMIRGKEGTVVRLAVEPADKSGRVIYNIVRARIELKGSEARSEVIETGRKGNGQPYKVGVINLPSFYMDMSAAQSGKKDFRSSTRDVKAILDKFKTKNVDVVVLDLRSNGGGSLPEAIKLTGLFIDKGPVVQVKDFQGEVESLDDEDTGTAWDGPLVVLTSKFSASASEILAGAIKDYRRGLVVGDETTHGKGTVQSLLDLGRQLPRQIWPGPTPPKLGALKITMQQFYRPDGDSTQNRGVSADIRLPSLASHMDVGESNLDYALSFDQVKPADYHKVSMVNDTIVDKIRALSAQRIKKNPEFQKLERNIGRYDEQKKRKYATLNEKKYLEDRLAAEAEADDDKKEEEQSIYDRPVVDRNFYFNETLDITIDYLQLLQSLAKAN